MSVRWLRKDWDSDTAHTFIPCCLNSFLSFKFEHVGNGGRSAVSPNPEHADAWCEHPARSYDWSVIPRAFFNWLHLIDAIDVLFAFPGSRLLLICKSTSFHIALFLSHLQANCPVFLLCLNKIKNIIIHFTLLILKTGQTRNLQIIYLPLSPLLQTHFRMEASAFINFRRIDFSSKLKGTKYKKYFLYEISQWHCRVGEKIFVWL